MNLKKLSVWLLAASMLPLSAEVKSYFIEMKHGDEQAQKAYFAQKVRFWGGSTYKTAPETYTGLLVLANKKITFAFRLGGKIQNGKAVNVTLGMVQPCGLNWYGGGFINIFFGNTPLKSGVFSVKEIKNLPESAQVTLEFKGEKYSGTLQFELADDDDKLQVAFTPENKNVNYSIEAYAYPGEYGDPKLRKRILTTSAGRFEDKSKKLDKNECWGIFSDAYYDRSLKRGRGCCAFLYNPQETSWATTNLGYACTIKIGYPAGRTAHLIFWDFNYWSLAQAVDYMKKLDLKFE